jgi:hypothetical protein
VTSDTRHGKHIRAWCTLRSIAIDVAIRELTDCQRNGQVTSDSTSRQCSAKAIVTPTRLVKQQCSSLHVQSQCVMACLSMVIRVCTSCISLLQCNAHCKPRMCPPAGTNSQTRRHSGVAAGRKDVLVGGDSYVRMVYSRGTLLALLGRLLQLQHLHSIMATASQQSGTCVLGWSAHRVNGGHPQPSRCQTGASSTACNMTAAAHRPPDARLAPPAQHAT